LDGYFKSIVTLYLLHGVSLDTCFQLGVEWVKNNLPDSEEAVARWLNTSIFDISIRECEISMPGSGGVSFLPFPTEERAPYPDPNAHGVFMGLSYETRKDDIVRGMYEVNAEFIVIWAREL